MLVGIAASHSSISGHHSLFASQSAARCFASAPAAPLDWKWLSANPEVAPSTLNIKPLMFILTRNQSAKRNAVARGSDPDLIDRERFFITGLLFCTFVADDWYCWSF